ncbi:MAG TPA: sulfite exporter TauE/SafE family protein [bacterium]|nr:sulfite exporter TauE/SafE family protein [bacterium]
MNTIQILLPVAGLSISLPVLVGVGMVVGFLSGMFGVGGGFLMTPILMMLGIPPTVAAASDSCQIVAAASSGTSAHLRLGHVDLKLGAFLLTGGVVGGWLGVRIIQIWRSMGSADLYITITYVVFLSLIGGYMFWESLRSLRRGALEPKPHVTVKREGLLGKLPFQMDFRRAGIRHSVAIPFLVGGLVGVLAAIMGVGGGFVMIPMMVYLLAIPTHVAVGTSLFQILFTSAGVTYMQAITNHTVDLMLVVPLAVGSALGAQLGAQVGKRLRGDQLLILLASIVLAVTLKLAIGLVTAPAVSLSN